MLLTLLTYIYYGSFIMGLYVWLIKRCGSCWGWFAIGGASSVVINLLAHNYMWGAIMAILTYVYYKWYNEYKQHKDGD